MIIRRNYEVHRLVQPGAIGNWGKMAPALKQAILDAPLGWGTSAPFINRSPRNRSYRSSSGCTHLYGVISRRSVNLIICTCGRPFLHDRHFNATSSFQIGVFRGRRTASSGMLASVLTVPLKKLEKRLRRPS
jgi:hypothetical protein